MLSSTDVLNTVIGRAIADWLATSPEAAGDSYYAMRVAQANVLGPTELAIGRAIEKYIPKNAIICEPGTGYGQLAIYLGSLGYNVIAFEQGNRFPGAQFVLERAKSAGLVKDYVTFVPSWYPDGEGSDCYFDLLITTNVVNDGWLDRTATDDGLRSVLRGKAALIDVKLFGREHSIDEQRELITRIRGLGYVSELVEGTESIVFFAPKTATTSP